MDSKHLRQIVLLAVNPVSKYFLTKMKNRFLLLKCITLGALIFPTPFFIFFFLSNIDLAIIGYGNRFLLISILLLSGALIGVASYYKDSAMAALRDWYPSDNPKPFTTGQTEQQMPPISSPARRSAAPPSPRS